MAPYVGLSGVVMDLDKLTAGGLVRQGTLVEIEEGLSAEAVAKIVAARFGEKPATDTESAASVPAQSGDAEPPRGNASRDDWVAYAITQGKTEDDLAGLKQGEIRALFDTDETEAKANAEAEAAAEAQAKADADAKAAEELAAAGNTDND